MRSRYSICTFVLAGWVLFLAATPSAALEYAVVDIDGIGFEALQTLQGEDGIAWWVELDDELLVLAESQALDRMAHRRDVNRLELLVAPERLFFLGSAHAHDTLGLEVDVLARGGRFGVVQARGDRTPAALGHGMATLRFRPDVVLARQWANLPPREARAEDARLQETRAAIQDLVDEVDAQRWFNDVTALAAYNRYTHGSEILDARDWLVLQFEVLPGLSVSTQSFQVDGTTAFNVVAELTGTQRPDDWCIIGAHYDATSENPGAAAPGAEDNASGCSGVLEMARIFTAHPPEATVFFICYSGEEQGLYGSVDHASRLVDAGTDDRVQAMLNMDMSGFTGDADLDCLLETAPDFAYLNDALGDAAALYTTLRIVVSLHPFGSDHVPYISRDMPAALTIENDWDSYPDYHRTTDLPGGLSLEMGGEILRMNVAAMAMMIGSAMPDAIFADSFESGDVSSWSSAAP
jgi:hypothetical protein